MPECVRYILRGDPGPFAPLQKLIEYLESLREPSNNPEVINERSAIRDYIRLRQQRPMRGDDLEQFRERLAALLSDD
jgi:hypothetical protein